MSTADVMSPGNCFVHRVGGLPLVAAATASATQRYRQVKGWHALLDSYLSFVESAVRAAYDKADPILEKSTVQVPLEKLNNVACAGLDKVEALFPAVRMTPREIQAAYYEGSRVQRGVESAAERLKSVRAGGGGLKAQLSSGLGYCEYIVDSYIAEEAGADGEKAKTSAEHDYTVKSSETERLRRIVGKVYSGVQLKASRRLLATVHYVELNAKDMEKLWASAKRSAWGRMEAAQRAAKGGTSAARDWTLSQVHRIQPEKYLLQMVQVGAAGFAVVSVRALDFTAHRLTPTYSDRLGRAVQQIKDAEEVVTQAHSFHDMTAEAKERWLNKVVVQQTYDYLASIPPFTWLERSKKPTMTAPPTLEEQSSISDITSSEDEEE